MPKSTKPPSGGASSKSRSLVPTKSQSVALAVPERLILGGQEIHPEEMLRIPERHPYGDGPWRDEPDRLVWTDAESGYSCLILRQAAGELAGYVAVGPSHPLWAFECDAIPTALGIKPHAGIDYAAACDEGAPRSVSICHPHGPQLRSRRERPQGPGKQDSDATGSPAAWWFGFRCDKAEDLLPEGYARNDEEREDGPRTYRDLTYVAKQTVSLARQLKALESAPPIGRTSDDGGVPLPLENKVQIRLPGNGGGHA